MILAGSWRRDEVPICPRRRPDRIIAEHRSAELRSSKRFDARQRVTVQFFAPLATTACRFSLILAGCRRRDEVPIRSRRRPDRIIAEHRSWNRNLPHEVGNLKKNCGRKS